MERVIMFSLCVPPSPEGRERVCSASVSLQVLPFPKDVVSQLDYNSRLRLSLCFFRLKNLLASEQVESAVAKETPSVGVAKSSEVVQYQPFRLFKPGMLQDMMAEVREGCGKGVVKEGGI